MPHNIKKIWLALIVSVFFVVPHLGQAQVLESAAGGDFSIPADFGSLVNSVPTADSNQAKSNVRQTMWEALQTAWKNKGEFLSETAAIAYRTGVRYLLTTLANDVGEWIGGGGKGQSRLNRVDSVGDYIKEAADSAGGLIIDDIMRKGYLRGFNVCEPNLDLQLAINLGLANFEPPIPECKFSTLKQNWEREIRKDNFLPDFRDSFRPNQNDLGIAFTMQSNLLNLQKELGQYAEWTRMETGPFKDVTDLVTGKIRTPGSQVESTLNGINNVTLMGELENTGNIIADSVDVFINAVARSYLANLMKNGLGGGGSDEADLFNNESQRRVEGAVAARARLAQQINPSFAVPGRYNVVSQLVDCKNTAAPAPNSCVITDGFATAINRRLTIKQAVSEGLINGDRPFGFVGWQDENAEEPKYNEGLPYRSIVILRTHRIVPVGWEIAARHIGQFEKKRVTLNELLAAYTNDQSPYFGLVDPDWVLVPPDSYCKLAGPGPEILSSNVQAGVDSNKDGDFDDTGDTKPVLNISRGDNYCADEQTCIKKNDKGACEFYGYCLEERPTLEFGGQSCEARNSTCSTVENLVTGDTGSYLLNTVDFADCNANTVGCQKYATWQRLSVPIDSDIRWDADRLDNPAIHLNNQAAKCNAKDDGCRAYTRLPGLSEVNDMDTTHDIQSKLDDAKSNGKYADDVTTQSLHLKRAPDWMGCRGCQAAGLGSGDKSVVDITDLKIVDGWNVACPSGETRWPCDDGDVIDLEVEQVSLALEQGTCSKECLNYAPFCSKSAVGCMAYTPTNGNPTITAVSGEQCGAECVGLDVYTQSPTFFENSTKFEPFIPSSAKQCAASEAGCAAFTNLTKEGAGGEAREYYKQIRHCQLKGQQNDAAVFYSWEGSDDTGFQLRVFELKSDLQTVEAPCTKISYDINDDGLSNDDGVSTKCVADASSVAACNENNYTSNPDCRQFYNTDGGVKYKLLSRTIEVSEQCVPLRMADSTPEACSGTATTEGSNGFWNTAAGACIYQAVPNKGQTCSAAAVGCRIYTGGTAASYRTLLSQGFEDGVGQFTGGQLSAVAADVGGHSYKISGTGNLKLDLSGGQSTVQEGQTGRVAPSSVIISFNARKVSAGTIEVNVKKDNDDNEQTITIGTEWQAVQLNAISLDNNATYQLIINANGGTVYLDDVQIKTTSGTFAVIKGSWTTPNSCKVGGVATGPEMLGCSQYNLSNGTTRNVYKFGKSCTPKAVGCEALVDTQNSTVGTNPIDQVSYGATGSQITVPADKVDYLVNDNKYRCNGTAQGCMLLGVEEFNTVNGDVKWTSAQLINNPDRYNTNLCTANQRDCSAFSNGDTTYYFKDPKNKVCEYRTDKPTAGWYKLASTATVPDCSTGVTPQRNFATGSSGNGPDVGWAGLCPAVANSCTEYIDPRSDGESNLLVNGRFTVVDNGGTAVTTDDIPRAWRQEDGADVVKDYSTSQGVKVKTINGAALASNTVRFEKKQLYTLSATVNKGDPGSDAFVGLSNCQFPTEVRYVNCANLNEDGNVAIPVSVDDILKAVSNATGDCSGGCNSVGDLDSNGKVTVDELLTMSSFALGSVTPQCTNDPNSYSSLVITPDDLLVGLRNGIEPVFGVKHSPVGNNERFSGRFYFNTNADVSCDVVVGTSSIISGSDSGDGHWFKEVSLRKANTYYQLADKIDKTSCNGVANNSNCVNLNERLVNKANFAANQTFVTATSGYSALTIDADQNKAVGGTPTPNPSDSNVVVKVTPTRQCNAWLSCRTTRTVVQNGVSKQVCLEVESCEQINSKGECTRRRAEVNNTNLEYNKESVDRIKNLSGFSKVGYSWDNGSKKIEGRLSVGQMSQVGQVASISNGNFEIATNAGEPTGWFGWENGVNMKVIADPVAARAAGAEYPAEGRKFLEVNANRPTAPVETGNINMSDFVAVGGSTSYTLSALINTTQLSGATATVQIIEYNSVKTALSIDGAKSIKLNPNINWKKVSTSFNTDSSTAYIKILLTWSGTGAGVWHVDDIKLSPGLKLASSPDKLEPQSCKLYPQNDAPSCKYYDENGLLNMGKTGYCLEWDTQNSNSCLQWWPVDSVIGEDLGEDRVGYDGPVPLYYCADTRDGWVTLITPEPGVLPTAGDRPAGKFTNIINTKRFESGSSKPVSNQEDAKLKNLTEFQVEVLPVEASNKGINNYRFGGLVDKPGDCNGDTGGPGCEVLIWSEVKSSSEDDGYEVYVSKNGVRYLLTRWCEKTANDACTTYGTPQSDGYNTGQVPLWIDMAWAKTSNGTKIDGPFDTLILRSLSADGTSAENEFLGAWIRPVYSCNVVVRAVSADGRNRGYSTRLGAGAPNINGISQSTTQVPFGASSPPSPLDIPGAWDSSSIVGQQPLFPYPNQAGNIASSGVPYSCNINNVGAQPPGLSQCAYYDGVVSNDTVDKAITTLSQMFTQTYGIYEWDNNASKYIISSTRKDIDTSSSVGTAPSVQSITINGNNIKNIGTVTLSFTTNVNPDQLPIVAYSVDWGDGSITTQTGLRLQNKSASNPISLSHNYSYDVLRDKGLCSSSSCSVKPKVQIIDNWGWCNNDGGGGSAAGCLNNNASWKSDPSVSIIE